MDDQTVKQLLVKGQYLTADDLVQAENLAKVHGQNVVDYLIQEGIITKTVLGQAIAEAYGLAFADLSANPPAPDDILKIPEETSRRLRAIVYKVSPGQIIIATDQPTNQLSTELQTALPGIKIQLAYALKDDIEEAYLLYLKPLAAQLNEVLNSPNPDAPLIIETIFDAALTMKASDIHLEPQENKILVRFRVDGVLQPMASLDQTLYENILNRIKVQSHLRIDEHFAAQDGAMHYQPKSGEPVDLRISLVPALSGEKVVIRILSNYIKGYNLADLGLSAADTDLITAAAKKPFGMILVTGPTGSGKTTTLYGLVKLLNQPQLNITTIEDPVEYRIKGINQIQVNPDTNLTFAQGLRSIIRQDPNIILVGEIRDLETAEIAVNAALTGHLLLSTFHSNDAASAIPRLLDIGVEPFLMASTLELIVAQRLMRRICSSCRYSMVKTRLDMERILNVKGDYFPEATTTLYKGKGCKVCNGSGYKGRIGIFELIVMTPELEELILSHPSSQQIWQVVKKQPDSHTLFEDGIEKVKKGLTTIEELKRVANPNK